MPKTKTQKPPSSSDSDSGPDDHDVPPKRVKRKAPAQSSAGSDDEADSWELGRRRFVKLTEFKGKWYVNIREYYEVDGDIKPTKKGVMLTMEQWQKFKSFLPDIEDAIKKHT